MSQEIELELYFCPKCRKEEMCGHSTYCGRCGTKIMKIEMLVYVEEGKVERLVLMGSK